MIYGIYPDMNTILMIIIISYSVDDRDKKPRYVIEVILNLSRYQPALGNEIINTKTNKYKEYTYFETLFCSFVFCLIKNQCNTIKSISQYQ